MSKDYFLATIATFHNPGWLGGPGIGRYGRQYELTFISHLAPVSRSRAPDLEVSDSLGEGRLLHDDGVPRRNSDKLVSFLALPQKLVSRGLHRREARLGQPAGLCELLLFQNCHTLPQLRGSDLLSFHEVISAGRVLGSEG